jgi:hypothetical protein
MGFFQRGTSAMMAFLGLGLGVSIFRFSWFCVGAFCASRDLRKVRTNIGALKKYL